jgi:cation diffusion facilitator family transporter
MAASPHDGLDVYPNAGHKATMASEKEQVALTSIVASAGLTAAKAVVGVLTGSLAILSEAAHSLIDLLATVMTYFAVRIADKPADDEHHYGHGKIESISALAETALLFVLSVMVIWEAGKRLLGETHLVEASIAAFVVMGASIIVDFFRARALTKIAKKTDSEALEADALHFSSDMWSSGAVILGLGGVALGFSWMDSAAAILVAVLICFAGWRLGKRTIDTLTDVAPSGVAEQLREAIENVEGVLALERIRTRKVGATLFVDIDVGANRALPMDGVAALKARVETAVRKVAKSAELSIAATPRALDDETVLERVMVIAHNRKLAVHHVTVQAISGRLSVSLDLEVNGALPLGAAHDIASELETAIKNEIGSDIEVETHIEPLQVEDIAGHDAWPERVDIICAALARIAESNSIVRDIHDVRVRETAEGEIVNFHCFAEPSRTVHDVHENVDSVERELRKQFPQIHRVIGHAEPRAE